MVQRRRPQDATEPTTKTLLLIFASSAITLALTYAAVWCVGYAKSSQTDWSTQSAYNARSRNVSAPEATSQPILLPGRIHDFADVQVADNPRQHNISASTFSQAYSRLDRVLKARPDRSTRQLVKAVNGTPGSSGCQVGWTDGEPALHFQLAGKNAGRLPATLNHCADAIEKLP